MMNIRKRRWTCWIIGLVATCWLGCDTKKGNAAEEKAVVASNVDTTKTNANQKAAEVLNIDTAAWTAFPKKWVGLERSKSGYVVYQPCDIHPRSMDLDSLKLKIDGQWHDGEMAFAIKDFQKINENEYQLISADEGMQVQLNMKLVRPSLNLWLFDGLIIERNREQPLKWVMTDKANAKKFPVVKNPCPTEKIPEKEFLPIEF